MAHSLTLLPLGVGDSRTTRHNFLQLLLVFDERHILVECPAYVRKTLDEANAAGAGIDFSKLRDIFVTHIHSDTVGGLEELSWYQAFGPAGRRRLYAPGWLLEDVWSMMKPAMNPSTRFDPTTNPWRGGVDAVVDFESDEPPYWPYPAGPERFDAYFEPIAIEDDGSANDADGFSVSCMATRHIPHTVALKFEFPGFTLGFSSDTGFFPRLIEWLEGCDMVIHDVAIGADQQERNLHCSLDALLSLPTEFQEKTLLAHYPDDAYGDAPADLNHDLGGYRLLEQHKEYKLI